MVTLSSDHIDCINFILLERLRISEGLLKSKERETVLSFQQIKEKEDIREDTVQEEIFKLTEKSKKLNEKLTIAGKEIIVLKEELENEKETNITNSKKLQEKIDMVENSLADLGLKFRESDQLNRSLRAVLREKEDFLAEKDSVLIQSEQEQILRIKELQRKITQVEEDSMEYSSRIRILESASVKYRAQIAESDASNLLKDELLSSALSKQVRYAQYPKYSRILHGTVQYGTVRYSVVV